MPSHPPHVPCLVSAALVCVYTTFSSPALPTPGHQVAELIGYKWHLKYVMLTVLKNNAAAMQFYTRKC